MQNGRVSFKFRECSRTFSVALGRSWGAMDVEHGVRILAERPAEDFEPTEEEVRNYAEWLGLDVKERP